MDLKSIAKIVMLFGFGCLAIGMYKSVPYMYKSAEEEITSYRVSAPTTGAPKCVTASAGGICWTIDPPKVSSCQPLSSPNGSFVMKNEEAFMFVPAKEERGLASYASYNKDSFELKTGDKFEIQTTGQSNISNAHPCADAEGIYGYYDPFVDSPFSQNLGGLEFSIGSLDSKRYFAGKYYRGMAEKDGRLIFRVIDRKDHYKDNSGGFTVVVRRLKKD